MCTPDFGKPTYSLIPDLAPVREGRFRNASFKLGSKCRSSHAQGLGAEAEGF